MEYKSIRTTGHFFGDSQGGKGKRTWPRKVGGEWGKERDGELEPLELTYIIWIKSGGDWFVCVKYEEQGRVDWKMTPQKTLTS